MYSDISLIIKGVIPLKPGAFLFSNKCIIPFTQHLWLDGKTMSELLIIEQFLLHNAKYIFN